MISSWISIYREDGTNGIHIYSRGYGIDSPPLPYKQVLYILYNSAKEKAFTLVKSNTNDCSLVFKIYSSGLLFIFCTNIQNCPQNSVFFLNLLDSLYYIYLINSNFSLSMFLDVNQVVKESRNNIKGLNILIQELNVFL